MNKRKLTFKKKVRKNESGPSLTRIVLILSAVCAVFLGGYRLLGTRPQEEAEAAAYTDLDKARELAAVQDFAGARPLLERIVEKADDPAVTPEALLLLADIEAAAGEKEAALAHLERAATQYAGSRAQPTAALRYARLLDEMGRTPEARALYDDVRRNTAPEIRAAALVGLGRDLERQGQLAAARDQYAQAVRDAKWSGPECMEALDALGRLNVALIFSTVQTPESKTYDVQPGDSLTSIGIKLNTTQGLLCRANNLDETSTLRPGQPLKYTPKDFRIVIERSTRRLYLLDMDGVFRCYSVGLGMPGHETTLGKYKIGTKEKDPVWHKAGSEPIPAGDPRNELGTRWMPLVPIEEGLPTDLGIHGTIAPDTIGQYSSHGCARMHKEDVEELYDLVVRSTPVEIVEVFEPGHIETGQG